MRRFILAALVCAAALACGAQSAAALTLVYQTSGTSAEFGGQLQLPGAGEYRLSIQTSQPTDVDFSATWDWHWDVFLAPPPKPHSEYLDGNTSFGQASGRKTGDVFDWYFAVPKSVINLFQAGNEYEYRGIPAGTDLYYYGRAEGPVLYFASLNDSEVAFNYDVKLFRVDPIPEPSTWAIMLVGFFGLGVAMRSRRARASAALTTPA